MKTQRKPKVSIIIPVYNGENYVKEAIESALNQTYENIEVIVVDDGSTDNTKNIVSFFGDKIKYFYKENGGVSTALNYGIEKMSGDYFSWLSHDDLYLKEKIQLQVEKALELGIDTIIASNVRVVDKKLRKIQDNILDSLFIRSPEIFLAMDLNTGLNGCSLLIHKSLFKKAGKFNTFLKCTQDYDMWYRLSKVAKFDFVNQVLVLSRTHDLQDSKTKSTICLLEADELHYKILSKEHFKKIFEVYENDTEKIFNICKIYYISGYVKTAAVLFKSISNFLIEKKEPDKIYDYLNKLDIRLKNNFKQHKALKNRKQKTIAFYSNVWVMGGIEKVLSILLDYFVKDYNVILIIGELDKKEACFQVPEEVICVRYSEKDHKYFTLLYLLLFYNVDLFVGNPNVDYSFLQFYLMLKNTTIKTIAYNHYNYFLPYKFSWLYAVARERNLIYKNLDAVVWLSDYFNDIYKVSNNNGITIPNPSQYKITKTKNYDRKNIIVIGRFYDNIKRIDKTLTIFKEVFKLDPTVTLTIVGQYNLNQIIDGQTISEYLLKEKNLANNIKWVGEVDDPSIYLKKASIMLSTSESEGFSLSLLEAITFGLPCVILKLPGIPLVVNQQNGLIFEQNELNNAAVGIVEILNDKQKYQDMSKKSLQIAEEYTISKIIDKWNNLIEKVLNNDKPIDENKLNKKNVMNRNFDSFVIEYEQSLNEILSNYEKLEEEYNHSIAFADVASSKLGRLLLSIKREGKKRTLKKITKKIFSRK